MDISQTNAEVEEDIQFWLTIIKDFFSSYSANIIVIATHPDATDFSTLQKQLSTLSSLSKSCHCLCAHLLDTSTAEYQRLLLLFLQCISSEMPKIAYPIAVLSNLIDTVFGATINVDITHVISYIKNNDDVPLPASKENLDQLLGTLSHYSDIIYLPNQNSQSLIIVNILGYLEILLKHARSPSSSGFEASFLGLLGFHTDYSSDINSLRTLGNTSVTLRYLPRGRWATRL